MYRIIIFVKTGQNRTMNSNIFLVNIQAKSPCIFLYYLIKLKQALNTELAKKKYATANIYLILRFWNVVLTKNKM